MPCCIGKVKLAFEGVELDVMFLRNLVMTVTMWQALVRHHSNWDYGRAFF
jgi:hypothetical protein